MTMDVLSRGSRPEGFWLPLRSVRWASSITMYRVLIALLDKEGEWGLL